MPESAEHACDPYQCEALTGTCTRSPRDADRDGDPAVACGGRDCDDADPRRAGGSAETCDGVDNDCDGLADQGQLGDLLPSTAVPGAFEGASLASANGDAPLVASVVETAGRKCVLAYRDGATPISAPCTFLERAEGLVPAQPWARPIAGADVTLGAVFLDTSAACPVGRLAFRNTKGVGFENECGKDGESLPAFQPYDASVGREVAVAAYLRTSVTSRRDPVDVCSTLTPPAPLDLAWIERPGALAPAPRVYARRLALTSSRSMRPPALVPRGDAVILAAPAESSVGVWLLRAPAADGSGASVIPLVSPGALPALTGAVSVSAALATIDGEDHLALVAEIGCPPSQRIVATLLRLAAPGPVATVTRDVSVTDAALALATAPRVAFVAERREWWVGFVTGSAGGPRSAAARAMSAGGETLGDLLRAPLADALAAAPRAAAEGAAVRFDGMTTSALASAITRCR